MFWQIKEDLASNHRAILKRPSLFVMHTLPTYIIIIIKRGPRKRQPIKKEELVKKNRAADFIFFGNQTKKLIDAMQTQYWNTLSFSTASPQFFFFFSFFFLLCFVLFVCLWTYRHDRLWRVWRRKAKPIKLRAGGRVNQAKFRSISLLARGRPNI